MGIRLMEYHAMQEHFYKPQIEFHKDRGEDYFHKYLEMNNRRWDCEMKLKYEILR